jgi:hypothetical protein
MNTTSSRSRSRISILGAFFAILAALLFGSLAQTSSASAQSPSDLPNGYLKICKVYEATGDADQNHSFQFNVKVDLAPHDGVANDQFQLSLKVDEGGKLCSEAFGVQVMSKVTVTEILPAGWNNAPGYPKYEVSGPGIATAGVGESVTFIIPTACLSAPCNVVFWNKEEAPKQYRFPIRVCKSYLNNEDGLLNAGTVFNFDINGNPFNINAAESETNCKTVWVTVTSADDLVTITEHLPAWWNSAPGYPKVEIDSNPFDDNDHGVSSNSITFPIKSCLEHERQVLTRVAAQPDYYCTVVFYNLQDKPGDDCLRLCEPPEEECLRLCEPPEEECREDCEPNIEEECRENCDEDIPECTEPCGEPLCAEDCDEVPGDTPETEKTPEPKAPNTGTGLMVQTATNPTFIAAAGIAILMVTVLAGMAILPKRR